MKDCFVLLESYDRPDVYWVLDLAPNTMTEARRMVAWQRVGNNHQKAVIATYRADVDGFEDVATGTVIQPESIIYKPAVWDAFRQRLRETGR